MPVAKTKSTKSSGKRKAVKGVRGKYLKQYGAWSGSIGVKTYHDGANDERTAILAKVRRMRKGLDDPESNLFSSPYAALEGFEKWILQRNERYKKNPGGL